MIFFIGMHRVTGYVNIIIAVTIILIILPFNQPVFAADPPPESEVTRQTTVTVPTTEYIWWVIPWSGNLPVCTVIIDHTGMPTHAEIYDACGKEIYTQWSNTPACTIISDKSTVPRQCQGYYLHLVTSRPSEKTVAVDLPPAEAKISLVDCNSVNSTNRCSQIPSLLVTGYEPLPDYEITSVHVNLNGLEYTCPGSTCKVQLSPTTLKGVPVEFWVDSSYGDTSPHYTALVRVVDTGVSPVPGDSGWLVDIISPQWEGKPIASCAQIWDVFPPIEGLPAWLSTPEAITLLTTNEPFQYLAGRLISQGIVKASDCPGGGLLSNGYADACGLEKALPIVQEWQNRFDSHILEASASTGVPAQLMKNIFAQESQFWPGAFKDPKEFGLGQITDNGAETILLWNQAFFNQFCPQILDKSTCARGYVYLSEENQSLLRGALASKSSVDCPTCSMGMDLDKIDFSINLFAQTILANCSQVSRMIYNTTDSAPADVSDYVNLWKLTIANYHIGPGCLSYAMYQTWQRSEPMDWEHISAYLTAPCQGVIEYVEQVTK
jgi:hypothetical protein